MDRALPVLAGAGPPRPTGEETAGHAHTGALPLGVVPSMAGASPGAPMAAVPAQLQMHARKPASTSGPQTVRKKIYKCEECGKTFNQSGNLNRHKAVHNKERKFKCDVCGKGFTQKSHVKTHQTVHTGAKRFECSHCNKRFGQRGHLNGHLERHHKDGILDAHEIYHAEEGNEPPRHSKKPQPSPPPLQPPVHGATHGQQQAQQQQQPPQQPRQPTAPIPDPSAGLNPTPPVTSVGVATASAAAAAAAAQHQHMLQQQHQANFSMHAALAAVADMPPMAYMHHPMASMAYHQLAPEAVRFAHPSMMHHHGLAPISIAATAPVPTPLPAPVPHEAQLPGLLTRALHGPPTASSVPMGASGAGLVPHSHAMHGDPGAS